VKKEFKVPVNAFIMPTLYNGSYTWTVQSINQKNEISRPLTSRSFIVEPMAQLSFKDMENKVYYTTSYPSFKFQWNTLANAENYRLKVSQSQSLSPNEMISVKEGQFSYQIGKEGIYFAQVEALNREENSIARSEIFVFTVAKPPIPPTPLFAATESKKTLEATPGGDIFFELINYDKKYIVVFEIKDTRGSSIEQLKSNSPKASFKSLPPGIFYLTAKFVDGLNQTGETSERRTFIVPDKSSISAPKVKGIKIR
jgi:hypothetical protein